MSKATFSVHDRASHIQRMNDEVFDLVIIGGGITGVGVARDAVSRGMKVAVVEKQDFAAGTSSRSSKLIHGGIRYLENLEFGLVFEALSERRLLFEIAPHLVHPLRFVLPLYKGGRVGMFKMGLGMWLYDALSMFEAPEMHERLSADESVERLPLLKKEDLLGSYVYSDAYMDDDRLVLETLRSAVAQGACAASYIQADGVQMSEGHVTALQCKDLITQKRVIIRGKHFVSTVGPWTDIVATDLLKTWRKLLRPSKGVHLTFNRNRLPMHQAVVMAADAEKRIVFGIPRHEMTIVGTTDTDFSGDPGDVSATSEDVKYLLNVAEEYFPGAKLTADDIVASYAGVRPLVDDGSVTESKTSREHTIYSDPRNVTFVAGGKYTTYRLMAQHAVEETLHHFSLEEQVRFARNNTKLPLNPLATLESMEHASRCIEDWSKLYRMSAEAIGFLIGRHGEEAIVMLEEASKKPGPASDWQRVWAIEARHAIQHTMCFHLVDFYVRRSQLFLSQPDHGVSQLGIIGHVFAQELGWSDAQRQGEVNAVRAHINKELAWKSAFGISAAGY